MNNNHNNYRDGKVHVMSEKCSTCVFHPGNLMSLKPGRLKQMIRESTDVDGVITCHKTLEHSGQDNAICRGYFDSYANGVAPLRLAKFYNLIEEVQPPVKDVQS